MDMIGTQMNLISFVKLLPKNKKAQILYNQDTQNLDIKTLAEHQYDKVTGVDYLGECFVITIVSPDPPTIPSPFLSTCNCRA